MLLENIFSCFASPLFGDSLISCDSFSLHIFEYPFHFFCSKRNGKDISLNIFVVVDEKGVLNSLKIDFLIAIFK